MILLSDITEQREVNFWVKVKSSKDGCWLWVGATNGKGYGRMTFVHRPSKLKKGPSTHQISWMIHNQKDIPKGKLIMHKCDNPACVRPDHLELGTNSQNIKDAWARGQIRTEIMNLPKGDNHPHAVLTSKQVIKMRKMASEGISYAEIARTFNVTPPNVSLIVRYKSWKHLK